MTRYFLGRDGGMPTPVPDDEPGNRAETLAHSAFYTEVKVVPFDAIVIRRDELPEVYADKSVVAGPVAVGLHADPDDMERAAIAHLAIARHLREHPPVDEEQVKALTKVAQEVYRLRNVGPFPDEMGEWAEALVRAGVHVNDAFAKHATQLNRDVARKEND